VRLVVDEKARREKYIKECIKKIKKRKINKIFGIVWYWILNISFSYTMPIKYICIVMEILLRMIHFLAFYHILED